MPTRSGRAPLTPAQAIAAGRKALAARRQTEARARRQKWTAPVVIDTTVLRVSASPPNRWPRCWTWPRAELDVVDAAYRDGFAAGRRAEESAGAWERGEPSPSQNPPPSAGEGVEPSTTPPQPAATRSEKPVDLSTSAPPAVDTRRKAAFNGGQVRQQRPVTLAKGRGAQDADASLRAIRAGAAKRRPKVVSLGEGAGQGGSELAPRKPIAEQNQRLEPVVKVRGDLQKPAQNMRDPMHRARAGKPTLIPEPTIEAAKINAPFGGFRLADLGPGQCRFACTDDHAPSHRFCGRPTRVGPGNRHGSWCDEHLARVWGRGSEGERNAARVLRRYG